MKLKKILNELNKLEKILGPETEIFIKYPDSEKLYEPVIKVLLADNSEMDSIFVKEKDKIEIKSIIFNII